MVVVTNCEGSESDKAIEHSEELNDYFPPSPTTFPPSPSSYFSLYSPPSPTYFTPLPTTFPPSPSYFPLYSPPSPPQPSSSNSAVIYVWTAVCLSVPQNQQHADFVDPPDFLLAFLVEHKIQDRGGVLDVIPAGRVAKINELVVQFDDIVDSRAKDRALEYSIHNDFDDLLPNSTFNCEFENLETHNEDIIDQLVVDGVYVNQYLIQYSGGALDDFLLLGMFRRINGSESIDGQFLTSTPEPALIFQDKLSLRLWQGHRGQWVADICYGWNWLNKTVEGAPLSSESVVRLRGGKHLFDYRFPELFVNENRAEPAKEIQMQELPPTEEQENPDEELGCSEATGNDEVEAEATRNDGFEAVGIRNCNGCDSTPIQGSQSTLTYACWEHGIEIWPPHPHRTTVLVDQEEIPLLNSDTLPSDQALAATVDPNSVLVEEIPPPLVFPIARQENLDENLGNDEVEAVGIGGEGIEEDEIGEAQLHTGCFGKRKRKEKSPRGERGNKKTTRVRNVLPLEEILQIKGMHLKDDARHLNVSRSTLKRVCRDYNIHRWPPREEHKLIGQSHPNESSAVVDQKRIPQLNYDILLLPSNQNSATSDTNSATVKAKYGRFTIKFRLSRPWRKVELEEHVKRRLQLEVGTYHIEYKDEDGELILIGCDQDLQDCIPSSSPMGTSSIELFLS